MKLCGASNGKWLKHGYLDMVIKMKLMLQTCPKYAQIVLGQSGYHTVEPLCNAVEQLSNVLRSEHVARLMTKFNKMHSSIPNFRVWSTYVDMVEILMEFIRAERDDNWTLHLEVFSVMLPWLTIYEHTSYAQWGCMYFADMKLLEKTWLTHPSSWRASWLSDVLWLYWCVHEQCDKLLQKSHNKSWYSIWPLNWATFNQGNDRVKVSGEEANSQGHWWT